MVRANAAAILIVLVVLVLALAAIVAAFRAERSARAARDAAEKLWEAYPAQARANRFGGMLGRKGRSLQAIATAAQIRPSLELRNEAIATLALVDLQETAVFRPLKNGPQLVAFSADLDRYTLWQEGRLDDVETKSGKLIVRREMQGFSKAVAASPRGKYFAMLTQSGDLALWDVEKAAVAFSVGIGQAGETEWAFDISPDEERFAIMSPKKSVRVLALPSGSNIAQLRIEGKVNDILLHPRQSQIALVRDSKVEIWDWERAELLRTLSHSARVDRIAWRPDGNQIATSCVAALHLWNLNSGGERRIDEHTAFISALTYNHSGTMLASTAFDGTTRFWEPYTGRSLLSTHRGFGVQFSADDTKLAFTRQDQDALGLWQVTAAKGARTVRMQEPSPGLSVAFSPNGELLALMAENGLHLFALGSTLLREVCALSVPGGRSVHFRAARREIVITGTEGVFVYGIEGDLREGTLRVGARKQVPAPRGEYIEYSALGADGRTLAVDLGRQAAVIDLENPAGAVLCSDKDYNGLAAVAISPEVNWVVTGTFHGSGTRIWNAKTGELLRELDSKSASVTVSPDGRWLVTGSGRDYEWWDTSTWQSKRRIARDTADVLTGPAAFSRDGKLVAIAQTQRLIQLLNGDTGEEIASLQSPEPQFLNKLAVSEDGALIAAATSGLGLQVWDLRELHQELTALNLDWETRKEAPVLNHLNVPAHSSVLIAPVLGGVFLAVGSAFFVLRRHRRLLEAYGETELQMIRRNRELELAKAEVMHSQKMKALGTLAAGIAHDFNNLLSVIRMSNKLIGRSAPAQTETQENVAEIEHAVQQGKRVVASMLGYSRDENESGEPFLVSEVVEDTVALLNKQFLRGIALTLELASDTPKVCISRGRLEQALLNLLVNAAEAMNCDGSLLISVQNSRERRLNGAVLQARAAAQYIELVVTDSGPGIPPEIIPEIFEPFFTTKRTGTAQGTGLGLSLVYSIAEQDGLGLSVETTPPKGATFRLLIPVV